MSRAPEPRWLVTGAGGMLGRDLLAALEGRPVTALTRDLLDVTDPGACRAAVAGHAVVVNAAAWTDVDGAEEREREATAVNGDGPRHLAEAARAAGARLLHVSTDYVFAGDASTPYPEDAPLAPRSAYGRGKAEGERAVRSVLPDAGYVVRTAWLYGRHGPNFAATILRLLGQRDTVDVVDDQRGQPTWSRDVAARLVALGESGAAAGVYHASSSGETTWCGFARAVAEEAGLDPQRVRPTTSDRFPRPAPRPAYSVLGHAGWQRAGLPPLRDWREALTAAVAAGTFPPA